MDGVQMNPGALRTALRRRVVLPLVGIGLVLAAWYAFVLVEAPPVVVLPSPGAVAVTFAGLLFTAAFWRDVGASVFEFGVGYVAGGVLGVVAGVAMGESRRIRQLASPVVESLRFVVPFAWIPLTILWFGTSYLGKIALVAYAVFFVMLVSTARAVAACDPTLTRVGTVLGFGPLRMAFGVHLRAAAPTVASAARAAAAIGWIAVVAGEYIGASSGLGLMVTNAASSLATALVIAGMVAIGLIGAAVSALVAWVCRAYLDYL